MTHRIIQTGEDASDPESYTVIAEAPDEQPDTDGKDKKTKPSKNGKK